MEQRLGPYSLLKRIGRGGMAEVLLAERADGTQVVVKRMLPHLADEAAYHKLFIREARIAARLNHENVVRLLDADRDGDSLYLVFELVDGVTLYELARRAWQAERPLPVELCIRAVADAAIGLHHAHELVDDNGVAQLLVHRDVSPDNLMIDTAGVTRVLDFGIAKPADDTAGVSKTGELRGKLAFMSPEQAQGLAIDRRSDLFSLGTTLFWLLTAQKPFAGRTDILTLRALLEQDAPVPSHVNPQVPAAIDPIVARLLAKAPADRFNNGKELHDALTALVPPGVELRTTAGAFVAEIQALKLDAWKDGTEIVLGPATVPSASVIMLDVQKTDVKPKLTHRRSRAPAIAAIAAVVALAAVAAAAVWLAKSKPTVLAHDAGVGAALAVHDAGAALASRETGVGAALAVHDAALGAHDAGVAAALASRDAGVGAALAGHDGGVAAALGVRDGAVEADAGAEDVDDIPLEPVDPSRPRPSLRRVVLVAPAGVVWKARTVRGGAEVSPSTRALTAVDAQGGVHSVPIVDGKADYGALKHGTVPVWLPPTGGEVFVGGKRVGEAPLKPLDLVVGRYKLRAKSGDKVDEQTVVVVAGTNSPVRFFAHQ